MVTDRIILLDDSGSMKNYPRRIDALNDTLQRAASVATVLEPSGIYVRLLNYPRDEDGGFDHMTDANTIVRKVKGAYQEKHDIYTRLGTVLQKKIVRPLVDDKIAKREFNKPLLVYIITDGMVSLRKISIKYKQWARHSHFLYDILAGR